MPDVMTRLCAPVVALLLCSAPGLAQEAGRIDANRPPNGDRFDGVRALINRLIVEEGVPSVAVAVAKDGEILWEEAFGWADRERRMAATPHTPYSLASITKPMTATAALVLSERGKFELDTPIESHLGQLRFAGYAGDAAGVTARRIMAHSAGLPQYYYFYHSGYPPPSPEQTLARYGMVVFPPAQRFEYSNIGYHSLAIAISRVSGQPFSEFLRREVFLPLGMTRSALDLHPSWAAEAATRYDGKGRPIPPYSSDHPGSGDVWSSAHDLLRFGMFHVGTPLPGQRAILGPEAIRTMQQIASAPGAQWGLGWSLGTDRGYRVVRHGGQQPGVDNQLVLYPDENVVVVMLANQNNWKVRQVVEEIAAVVLPHYAERKTAATAPGSGPEQLATPSGRWAGTLTTHEGAEPFTLVFQPDGDVLARVGERMTTYVNNFRSEGGAFVGWMYGVMNTSDALRHRHNLNFTLLPQGDELIGQLVAYTPLDPGVFGLPAFLRLTREPAEASK
ncbi:MAG: beta-lactamase family protein [Gemmatimonadetes bacterium]|nr:beta-lactamase family protein [Gemmatimonadota bacterium]